MGSRDNGPLAQSAMSGALKDSRSQFSSTTPMASILNAFGTNPRAVWASCDEYLTTDSGSTTSTQYFATRVKTRIAGGKWLALAPVFFCGCQTSQRSPVGTVNIPAVTLAWNLELANGTLTPTDYTCPNTGGTILPGTFNGQVDGIMRGGDFLVGDFIYASAAGLPYFEWIDRTYLPWLRVAWSKKNASDSLFATTNTEYNFPCNSHFASCTSYASAKTLIGTSGISSYNSGNDHWGSGDSSSLPSCLGFIGIGLSGQKSLIFFGTSIFDGDGSAPHMQGGVNPSNNVPQNYDLLGFPNAYGQALTNSVPVMNFGVGASSCSRVWASSGTQPDWVTNNEDIALQRGVLSQLVKWFDICVGYDVQNDNLSTFGECVYNFSTRLRSSNPALKLYACKVPNGYTNESGVTTPYDSAGLDPKWAVYDAAVSSGLFHGMISVRESGVDIFADLGTQYSSTTTSTGSMTTLNDSNATWYRNQWVSSFVSVGGTKRLITGNTRNQLTFNAFASVVGSSVAYTIEGNTTGDGLHPNEVGQKRMASNFKIAIAAYENIPYFTRSA